MGDLGKGGRNAIGLVYVATKLDQPSTVPNQPSTGHIRSATIFSKPLTGPIWSTIMLGEPSTDVD